MKYIIFILFTLLIFLSTSAQAPPKMSYQTILRSNEGQTLIDQKVGVRISVLMNSTKGEVVYSEKHNKTTNSNGLLTLIVGTGFSVQGDLSSISWGDTSFFLKTEIDPNGLCNYSIFQTTALLSIPYAFFAMQADSVAFYDEKQDLYDVLVLGECANSQIKNGIEPIEPQDAATKAYVDKLEEEIDYLISIVGKE